MVSSLAWANRDLGEKDQKKAFSHDKWNPDLQLFSHHSIQLQLFLGCVESLVAVEISGRMNDFAIWKGHLPAPCLPSK